MKKVTAKHLMIGDWVKYKGKYEEINELPRLNGSLVMIFKYSYIYTKSATPIPITYDWLMLNGFEDSCTGMYERLFNGFKVKLALIGGTYSISISKDGLNRFIIHNQLYIHQLQQAYRLATRGKELKIKF